MGFSVQEALSAQSTACINADGNSVEFLYTKSPNRFYRPGQVFHEEISPKLIATGLDFVSEEFRYLDTPPRIGVALWEDDTQVGELPPEKVSIESRNVELNPEVEASHGTGVAQIILSESLTNSPSRLVSLGGAPCEAEKGWSHSDSASFYRDVYQGRLVRMNCRFAGAVSTTNSSSARLINYSGAMGNARQSLVDLRNLDSSKIMITSGGNNTGDPTGTVKQRVPAIVVGGANGFGNRSSAVDILGPITGQPTQLTSGATPTVTGTLAYALKLLPGLNLELSEELLRESGHHTTEGIPYLNSYRLMKAAEKIRHDLDENGLLPTEPNIQSRLQDPKYFDFKEDAATLVAEAMEKLESENCTERHNAVNILRKAFLLNPSPDVAAKLTEYIQHSQEMLPLIDFHLTPNQKIDTRAIRR